MFSGYNKQHQLKHEKTINFAYKVFHIILQNKLELFRLTALIECFH